MTEIEKAASGLTAQDLVRMRELLETQYPENLTRWKNQRRAGLLLLAEVYRLQHRERELVLAILGVVKTQGRCDWPTVEAALYAAVQGDSP